MIETYKILYSITIAKFMMRKKTILQLVDWYHYGAYIEIFRETYIPYLNTKQI
jgi:hypothetical protein